MMRRLVGLAVVALTAAACTPYFNNGVVSTTSDVPRIIFLGDSIINGAGDEIVTTFDAEGYWWHHILAGGGWTVQDINDHDNQGLASDPDAIIIAAGTNDTGQCLNDPECWPNVPVDRLDDLWDDYAAIGPHACRIGVTIVFDPGYRGAINTRLYELAAQGTITHVADWKAYSASHPEWFSDGVGHLNPSGQQAFADFLLAETDSVCFDSKGGEG
ncbi:MAG: SGNH/GDSL hydrolase family protein [Acidimicrobiales bacterium]